MKNAIKLLALAAVLLLTLVNCPQPDNNGNGTTGGGTTPQTPAAADYNVSGLSLIYDGNAKAVSITAKQGKSSGKITIRYEGTGGTAYTKKTAAPSSVGNYAVTFDVAAATGWNAASGLSAGTLAIANQTDNPATPVAADFDISGLSQTYDGSAKAVSIRPKQGKTSGNITVYYEGGDGATFTTTAPVNAGSYPVVFNVAAAVGFNAANLLPAGTMTISPADPIAADFNISGLEWVYDGSAKRVSITAKQGKTSGAITVYYEGTAGTSYPRSTTAPSAAGSYAATFNVTAAANFNAANALPAGTMTISPATPVVADFNIGYLIWNYDGNAKEAVITAKQDKTSGGITVYYEGTGGTAYPRTATAPSAEGSYSVTFDVAAAPNFNATNGLSAGTLSIFNNTFTSIADLGTWLSAQPVNTAATPYAVVLNVADLGGHINTAGSLGYVLRANISKYLRLDLSGSTFTVTYFSSNGVFELCTNLVSVTIPVSVTEIGILAFRACTNLAAVTIPNSVTSIGNRAFDECSSLASVTIPDSVTSIVTEGIYNGAFAYCSSLVAIEVTGGNTAYISVDGVLYNKTRTTLVCYPAGKTGVSFTIPNDVTSIGAGAFIYCRNLASVTIPDSVTVIGDAAFDYCSSLTAITIPVGVPRIGRLVFSNCNSLTAITIPDSVKSIGQQAFDYCSSLASVTFESTIASGNFYTGSSFRGDLRAKFYETDPANGTPGTYTTTAPVSSSSVWTKTN